MKNDKKITSRFVINMSLLAMSLLACGCGSIYSPSLHLAHDPIEKSTTQLTAAASTLPQNGTGDLGMASCGEFEATYGVSNDIAIEAKGWSQASEVMNGSYNGGIALSAIVMANSKDASLPIAVIPSASMLIDGRSISAMGAMVRGAVWLPSTGIFRPYIAAGPGLLVNNFKQDDWGYGVLGNLGVSAKFSERFRSNLELMGTLQQYKKYNSWKAYAAPTFSVSWAFDKE